MGCGGSKFDPEAEAVPARIRPLLRRRLEEIRRRRHGSSVLKHSSPTDLSKKELLKHRISDDDSSSRPNHDPDSKSVSSQEDSLRVAAKPVETPLSESEKPANNIEVAKEALRPKSPKVAPEPEKLLKRTSIKLENKEEDKNKADDDNGDGRITDDSLYPGSPSFRVYFIESLTNSTKDDDDYYDEDYDEHDGHGHDKDDYDKKSQSEDSHSAVESINSNTDLESKKKKKTKRVHRLRKVIPMGKPAGAVKHLLNVKACYNPASSGRGHGHGHDKATLLTKNIVS